MSIIGSVKRRIRLVVVWLLVFGVGVADRRRSGECCDRRPSGSTITGRARAQCHGSVSADRRAHARWSTAGPKRSPTPPRVRDAVQARLVTAQQQEDAARARTDYLSQVEAQAASDYQRSRDRLARFAAAAYRDGPSVTPLSAAARVAHGGRLRVRARDRAPHRCAPAQPGLRRQAPARRRRPPPPRRPATTAIGSSLWPLRSSGTFRPGRAQSPPPSRLRPVRSSGSLVGSRSARGRRHRSWVRHS